MYNKKAALKTIAENLNGLYWLIDAGTAVEVYTNGKRVGGDIDIVTTKKDFEKVSKKLNAKITTREADKEGFTAVWGKYANGFVSGVPFEIICGDGILNIGGRKRGMNVTEEHLATANKIEYLGAKLNVARREWVLVQKALMGRKKDGRDIELLTDGFDPDIELLDFFSGMYQLNEEEKKIMLSRIM